MAVKRAKGRTAAVGAYVHVPFCASRCDYCAFATWTDRDHLIDAYLAALRDEIERAVHDGFGPVDTVFIGGGTPTLVPAETLMRAIGPIPRRPGAEVTIEANPDTVTAASLRTYRAGGVNRISIGVQSMVPAVLEALGRHHVPDHVASAVSWAREAGFDQVNLDLIMGGAGETVDDWERSLRACLDLGPDHVSAYGLTVEPGTPLAADPARHPDDDDLATKYLLADRLLHDAGLSWYEVSNWARPGSESRHNRIYWAAGDYRGFGCAAHSHHQGRRWWNLRTPERYIAAVRSGDSTEAAGEQLDEATRAIEALQLSLRTRDGVPVDRLDRSEPAIAALVDVADGRAVLRPQGRLLANEVSLRLLVDGASSGDERRKVEHLADEQQVRIGRVDEARSVGVDESAPVAPDRVDVGCRPA